MSTQNGEEPDKLSLSFHQVKVANYTKHND